MVTGSPENDFVPFKTRLVDMDGYSKCRESRITTLDNNPDVVVRVLHDEFYFGYLSEGEDLLAINKKELDKLSQNGILMPAFDQVLGGNPTRSSRATYYTVTQKILGVDLIEKLMEKNLEVGDQKKIFDETQIAFVGIARYLRKVTKKSGWYIDDVSWNPVKYRESYEVSRNPKDNLGIISQFMWGRRAGETEDHLYFVDFGPCLAYYAVEDRGSWSCFYGNTVANLRDLIIGSEAYLNQGEMIEARTELVNILDGIPAASFHQERALEIRKSLGIC